jgi:hypothetical protein
MIGHVSAVCVGVLDADIGFGLAYGLTQSLSEPVSGALLWDLALPSANFFWDKPDLLKRTL